MGTTFLVAKQAEFSTLNPNPGPGFLLPTNKPLLQLFFLFFAKQAHDGAFTKAKGVS